MPATDREVFTYFQEDPHTTPETALLAYAAYVGFLQLSLQLQQPKQAREDFEAYVEHLIETLIPNG